MVQVTVLCLAILGADRESAKLTEELRPFHAIQGEISDLLRREAQAKEPAAKAEIVRRMCELHGEILRDSRYANSDTLAEYRVRLWSRLRRVQTELKQQIARSASGLSGDSVASGEKRDPKSAQPLDVLAAADATSLAAADSLADSLAMLDQSQGGPGYLFGFGGRAGPPDYGQDLVDLIEQTINPAFWDTNGGPGTIVYYAPLRCIVVRATSEVHGNVGGVLGGLRAAGK
ncbi:MAG: hypothetical protein L0211_08735 [Planctomycetaceae bacterium]|nr:hypothetical protein [Planctomycetaceae bacterium]